MALNQDKQYQTLLILWFGLLTSVGMYALFSLFLAPPTSRQPGDPRSLILIISLTAVGTFLVIVSFAVKRKLLERSVERQDVSLVQKSLVIACAMCEVTALLGLFEHMVVGNRDYYFLFIVAAAGIALHFPRRNQLESASYKNTGLLS